MNAAKRTNITPQPAASNLHRRQTTPILAPTLRGSAKHFLNHLTASALKRHPGQPDCRPILAGIVATLMPNAPDAGYWGTGTPTLPAGATQSSTPGPNETGSTGSGNTDTGNTGTGASGASTDSASTATGSSTGGASSPSPTSAYYGPDCGQSGLYADGYSMCQISGNEQCPGGFAPTQEPDGTPACLRRQSP